MPDSVEQNFIRQAGRWLEIDTPLGKDVLILTSFSGEEALSRPFSFRLELVSQKEQIEASEILGKRITFSIQLANGRRRVFNGIVRTFVAGGFWLRGYRHYHAEVVPWLWFLGRTTDCRIFQEKTALDIIRAIFGEYGFTDYEIGSLSAPPRSRDYCVQYRESDLDFVSRLLEEEGIFYFFRHEAGRHKLVIADTASAYYDSTNREVEYRVNSDIVDHISRWQSRKEFTTGRQFLRDFNFETPTSDLSSTANTIVDLPPARTYEFYDYPGLFDNKRDGTHFAKRRIEEEEVGHASAEGSGTCAGFSPGAKFKLIRHECRSEEGKTHALVSLRHAATDFTHLPGEHPPPSYSNDFTCIPHDVVYRPPRLTRKPFVQGPQTAFVVGPAGEEIYCDKYGRVKVQFHWDREGRKDEKSSCWIRVGQDWAGKRWGAVFIPRIGMEVIVSFLEGDPDRPLITGCVYNAESMPPYALPGEKTKSGIKTRSSKQGGDANFNEIRFEDAKGKEEVYVHAEKDMNRVVEHDDSHEIGHDQEVKVKNDQDITIEKGNRTIKVEAGFNELEAKQYIELKVGQSVIRLEPAQITIKSVQIQVEAQALLVLKGGLITIN